LKENEQDGENNLNYDRKSPRISGIAVHNPGVDPRSCANRYGASKDINHGSKCSHSHNRPEKDDADSNQQCADEAEVSVQKQRRGSFFRHPPVAERTRSCGSKDQSWSTKSEEHQQTRDRKYDLQGYALHPVLQTSTPSSVKSPRSPAGKAENHVIEFLRTVERQEVSALCDRRHLRARQQPVIVLARRRIVYSLFLGWQNFLNADLLDQVTAFQIDQVHSFLIVC
jgi:hypothetical protein